MTRVSIIYQSGERFQPLSTLLYAEASEVNAVVYVDMFIVIAFCLEWPQCKGLLKSLKKNYGFTRCKGVQNATYSLFN